MDCNTGMVNSTGRMEANTAETIEEDSKTETESTSTLTITASAVEFGTEEHCKAMESTLSQEGLATRSYGNKAGSLQSNDIMALLVEIDRKKGLLINYK